MTVGVLVGGRALEIAIDEWHPEIDTAPLSSPAVPGGTESAPPNRSGGPGR